MRSLSSTIGDIRRIKVVNLHLTLRNIPPVQRAVKQLQRSNGLIIRHLVTGLINPRKREVPILPRLTILDPINDQRRITRSAELLRMRVVRSKRDGLTTEPVTDVIRITIDQRNTNRKLKNLLKIIDEVRPDEVARLLEGVVHLCAGGGVVEVDAEGVFDGGFLQVFAVAGWWGGVVAWVADVVDAAAGVLIVGAFDVVATHVGGFGADAVVYEGGAVCLLAGGDLVLAAVAHAVGEFHVVVDGVVDLFCQYVAYLLYRDWNLRS